MFQNIRSLAFRGGPAAAGRPAPRPAVCPANTLPTSARVAPNTTSARMSSSRLTVTSAASSFAIRDWLDPRSAASRTCVRPRVLPAAPHRRREDPPGFGDHAPRGRAGARRGTGAGGHPPRYVISDIIARGRAGPARGRYQGRAGTGAGSGGDAGSTEQPAGDVGAPAPTRSNGWAYLLGARLPRWSGPTMLRSRACRSSCWRSSLPALRPTRALGPGRHGDGHHRGRGDGRGRGPGAGRHRGGVLPGDAGHAAGADRRPGPVHDPLRRRGRAVPDDGARARHDAAHRAPGARRRRGPAGVERPAPGGRRARSTRSACRPARSCVPAEGPTPGSSERAFGAEQLARLPVDATDLAVARRAGAGRAADRVHRHHGDGVLRRGARGRRQRRHPRRPPLRQRARSRRRGCGRPASSPARTTSRAARSRAASSRPPRARGATSCRARRRPRCATRRWP